MSRPSTTCGAGPAKIADDRAKPHSYQDKGSCGARLFPHRHGKDKPGHDDERATPRPNFSPAAPYPDSYGAKPGHVTTAWPLFALILLTYACTHPLKPDPHYVLGKPYQAGPIWYYPAESYDLDETGLAAVTKDTTTRLTADGELFDQTALAAAHPSIQLPAIARVTNLETGLETTVRINDRGTGDPHRLVEITRRTAVLLGMPPDGIARVRVTVLPVESHAAAEALPGAPSLGLTSAPRGGVEVADLPPPPGIGRGRGHIVAETVAPPPEAAPSAAPPMRLPESVSRTEPRPGRLMVRLDTFDQRRYAAVQQARMAAAGAVIVPIGEGRSHQYRVEIGPVPDVAHADAILDQALLSGIPDARIIVD
nr:RlpA-like double-psi beta-barrel domain-containing protein [uncultured Rhodopila sp.]